MSGLLSSKSEALLSNAFWNIGFYGHITFGGIALLFGWIQFSEKFRNRNLRLHRTLGKIYVVAVLLSAICGFGIALKATGNYITSLGFMSLAVFWFTTTYLAFAYIRKGAIIQHQKMMIYSYAACFAAVTLRIWLPLFMMFIDDFVTAYTIIAWLCWVPNVIVAYLIILKLQPSVS